MRKKKANEIQNKKPSQNYEENINSQDQYFEQYYKAYKNDYISQYYQAYKEYKEKNSK